MMIKNQLKLKKEGVLLMTKKSGKPQRGLMPRWLLLELRNKEIVESLKRRVDFSSKTGKPLDLPLDWLEELLDNAEELEMRRTK